MSAGNPTYKFFLDNNQVADPKNWDEGKINYKRHDALNALLYEYVSDLVFVSDGYDYLSSALLAGFCNNVQLRIYKLNNELGTYYNLFEGIIKLRDAKVDEYKCEITVNAEDNTLIQQIIDFADNEFDLSGLKGMGWTVSAVSQKTLGLWDSANPSVQFQRKGYLVYDILQYLMNCMTQGDNPVTVVSDYYQTNTTSRYSSVITFLVPAQLQAPPNFTEFKWTNYLGEVITVNVPQDAVIGNALLLVAQSVTNFPVAPVKPFYYTNDFKFYQFATHNGVNTVTIESDLPIPNFTSILINGNINLPVAYSKTDTAGTDGMKNLALSTGAMLRGLSTARSPVLSFKKVFDELNKEHNLGCSIKNVQGVITFRIEPISYFFGSSTPSVTLTNVPGLKYEISPRFNKDQIKVGDGRNKENLAADMIIQNTWYSGTKCQSEIVDCKNSWVVDWDEIDKQIGIGATFTEYDEKIYLIECTTGTAGADYDSIKYRLGAVSTFGYAMNTHLTNYWKIRRWLFSMSGNAKFGTKLILNHNTIKPNREYTFDAPLKFTEAKTLRDNDEDFIVFGPTDLPQDFKYGWIEEISYDTKTSLTNFRLITT